MPLKGFVIGVKCIISVVVDVPPNSGAIPLNSSEATLITTILELSTFKAKSLKKVLMSTSSARLMGILTLCLPSNKSNALDYKRK